MRKAIYFIVLLPLLLQAQETVVFNDHVINDSNGVGAYSLDYGDIDNDGDIDILAGMAINGGARTVGLFKNTGNNNFSQYQEIRHIGGGLNELRGAKFIDANQDILPDIVIVESTTESIILYINDGNGNFNTPIVLDAFALLPEAFEVADLDGDGKEDIIYSEPGFSASLYWHRNLGGGSFTNAQLISFVIGDVNGIKTGHINNDAHLDMVLSLNIPANANDKIQLLFGDGTGQGTVQDIISVMEPKGLTLGDFNGDANMDFAYFDNTQIEWYANDGNGNFSLGGLVASVNFISSLDSGDVNNDGDTDIIFASNQTDQVTLAHNGGDGTDFNLQMVSDISQNPTVVLLADMDNDSDMDALSIAFNASKLVLHENVESLGLDEFEHDEIRMYPNPTTNFLNVSSKSNSTINLLRLYSLQGSLLFETNETSLNLDWLQKGVYLLEIITDKTSAIKKIVRK